MTEEVKVTEAPIETKASEGVIDNRRAEIEKLVIAANQDIPETIVDEVETKTTTEAKVDEKTEDVDPIERIKKTVQKRIDKVVAQKKSAEEELAEARAEKEALKAELERLKANPKTEEKEVPQDNSPPTVEQVEAYIIKMREEGNVKEEIAATRYLIKLEKEIALKEVEEKQTSVQKKAEAEKQKQLSDWIDLQRDYVAYDSEGKIDPNHDLNIANQKGLLYKTALSLFNDKELHRDFYNDPNPIMGFRRAAADAYREIHQQGLIKNPKGETIEVKRNPRMALADPSAEFAEETTTSTPNSLSDAEKVREEIKARKKLRRQ